jgi:hypothetical protein
MHCKAAHGGLSLHPIQVFPDLYKWTTHGITQLLALIWNSQHVVMEKGLKPSPYIIEFTAALERTLAFAFGGNAKVLSKSLMEPLWLSPSLIDVGNPCIKQIYWIDTDVLAKRRFRLIDGAWPIDKKTKYPGQASKASQIFNYGLDHYNVSASFIPFIPHSQMFLDEIGIRN